MKKQPLKKSTTVKKARPKTSKNQLKLISVSIAEHHHTGKLIHHRHTSHIILLGILVFLGLFLYVDQSIVSANNSGGSVSVSVVVPGTAPVKGAVISLPINGSVVRNNIIDAKGTCQPGSFVAVQSNGITVGSTICNDSGMFELKIQLSPGKNTLTALNYDNLNQPGPVTPATIVTLQSDSTSKLESQPTAPAIPINPSIIPGVNAAITDCSDYKIGSLPTGGDPKVSVVCVPRLFEPKLEQTLGVLVWGGTPPYAVSVDWGDGSSSTLISLKSQSYRKETFSYKSAGNYKITFNLKDSNGKTAIAQTAVQVNGQASSSAVAGAETPLSALSNELFNTSWFKTPVPLYVLIVAITLGFWGGDIFDRYFGSKKPQHRHRKVV